MIFFHKRKENWVEWLTERNEFISIDGAQWVIADAISSSFLSVNLFILLSFTTSHFISGSEAEREEM